MRPAPNAENAGETSPYEAVPYPHYVFPQTSPDNLAVLSRLYGLVPASPSNCRYLELGCGNGTNIAAFASRYPDSHFVGIDLAENHIGSAKQMSNELGLKNAEFIAANLLEIGPTTLGQFDFVVAHGLFSWVPDAVRARVLQLIKQCVAQNGVGYISYNALPGCHVREIGWDLLRFGTRNIENPKEKVAASIKIASFVARETAEGTPQKFIYQSIADELASTQPENVIHDDLSAVNRPFYFFEFARLLESNELKFLCEADPRANGSGSLSQSALNELDRLSTDRIEREQFLDFLDFASFRQSVICHAGAESRATPSPELLRELFCESSLRPVAGIERGNETHSMIAFVSEGDSVQIHHPLIASILLRLSESSPLPIRVGDAVDSSRLEVLKEAPNRDLEDEKRALKFLMDLYERGSIRLFLEQPPIDSEPAEKPRAHDFARWQAVNGLDTFTTLLGKNIAFGNDIVRLLIILLDGGRERGALAGEILSRLQMPSDQLEQARSSLPQIVHSNIEQLRLLGVLSR